MEVIACDSKSGVFQQQNQQTESVDLKRAIKAVS